MRQESPDPPSGTLFLIELTHMGVQCTAQAHVRMCWEQAGKAAGTDR
jgi:hypothetical protein